MAVFAKELVKKMLDAEYEIKLREAMIRKRERARRGVVLPVKMPVADLCSRSFFQ